jgi:hypothetical protein
MFWRVLSGGWNTLSGFLNFSQRPEYKILENATFRKLDQFRKIWGLHGGDYEECRLLGFKIPVHTSQESHYVSATEPSRLMLCKIWDFHGGDYEECRLLGYKNPVRTSQGTHFVFATELSLLMLYKIWGFHGGDYADYRLLGCYAVWLLQEPTFQRILSPPLSIWKESAS